MYADFDYSRNVFKLVSEDAYLHSDRAIYFDMDGTIADLYGVDDWLGKLMADDPSPYRDAVPLVDMELVEELCATAAQCGFRIGVVSWLSKGASPDYSEEIIYAKLDWCSDYLPIIDEIVLAPYGTPKQDVVDVAQDAILIDDEERNRNWWEDAADRRRAYGTDNLIEVFEQIDSYMVDDYWSR